MVQQYALKFLQTIFFRFLKKQFFFSLDGLPYKGYRAQTALLFYLIAINVEEETYISQGH